MGDVPIAGDIAEIIGCHKPMDNYVNTVQCNVLMPSDPCIAHICESAVSPAPVATTGNAPCLNKQD